MQWQTSELLDFGHIELIALLFAFFLRSVIELVGIKAESKSEGRKQSDWIKMMKVLRRKISQNNNFRYGKNND